MEIKKEIAEIKSSFDALDCYMDGAEGEKRLKRELITNHAATLAKIDTHIETLTFGSEASGCAMMRSMLKGSVKCFNRRLKRVLKELI